MQSVSGQTDFTVGLHGNPQFCKHGHTVRILETAVATGSAAQPI